MQHLSASSPNLRQGLSRARLGADLDRADKDNRDKWDARALAYDDLEPDDIVRELGDDYAETCAPLREARSAYFACARQREARRSVPRLPAGIGDDARAVVQAACDAAKRTRYWYKIACGRTDSTYRQRIDCAAEMERAEQIFEALRDKFNERVTTTINKKSERDATAQGRAFEWQEIAAQRAMLARWSS